MTINITSADLAAKAKALGLPLGLTYDQKINLYRGMLYEAGLNMPTDATLMSAEQSILATETSLVKAIDALTASMSTTTAASAAA